MWHSAGGIENTSELAGSLQCTLALWTPSEGNEPALECQSWTLEGEWPRTSLLLRVEIWRWDAPAFLVSSELPELWALHSERGERSRRSPPRVGQAPSREMSGPCLARGYSQACAQCVERRRIYVYLPWRAVVYHTDPRDRRWARRAMFAAFTPKSRVRSRERDRTSTRDEAAACPPPEALRAAVAPTSGGPG